MTGAYMRAEMAEQPDVLRRFAGSFEEHVEAVRQLVPQKPAGVALLARGSSDNAAVYGRYLAELASGRPSSLVAPSLHTLYRADVDYSGWLVVALSQSGATPEIRDVTERLAAAGARTVAIVNEAASPLAEAADLVIPLGAGPERAVPATKTVTSEYAAVAAVAAALGEVPFEASDWAELPAAVDDVLADFDAARAVAAAWRFAARAFVVARGYLFAAALEAALKIKETTGILAEGSSSADLRHGPIAAAGRDVPMLVLDGGGSASDDLAELVDAAVRRGSHVTRCAGDGELPLPAGVPEALAVVTATVRGQQLALALAEARGVDPDAPSGLSKVTPTT